MVFSCLIRFKKGPRFNKQIRRTAKKLLLQNGNVNLNNLYKIGIKALNLAWAQVQVVILCIFIIDVIFFTTLQYCVLNY